MSFRINFHEYQTNKEHDLKIISKSEYIMLKIGDNEKKVKVLSDAEIAEKWNNYFIDEYEVSKPFSYIDYSTNVYSPTVLSKELGQRCTKGHDIEEYKDDKNIPLLYDINNEKL
jgi:hypothetical protein